MSKPIVMGRKWMIAVFGLLIASLVSSLTVATVSAAGLSSKVVDCNGDNVIDSRDLSIMLSNFSKSGKKAVDDDFDNNSQVNIYDMSIMLSYLSTKSDTGSASDWQTIYRNDANSATRCADSIRKTNPTNAALIDKIGNQPGATWIGGYSGDESALDTNLPKAAAQKKVIVITFYGVPDRDNGQYSAGGFPDYESYAKWIDWAVGKIGTNHVIAIVEPDSVAMKMEADKQAVRWKSLNYAVSRLSTLSNTKVYLDAGTANWRKPVEMAPRLKLAGIDNADGFSVNVSNFVDDDQLFAYGKGISALVGNKPFVMDTSRNGNGSRPRSGNPNEPSEYYWCNPPGRALGRRPTLQTGMAGIDAFLWVKTPGSSDGECYGYPKAGVFIESPAVEAAKNAKW